MSIPLISLILANLIPLVGALAFGWSARTILAVYWLENGIIGAFTLLKIATVAPASTEGGSKSAARFTLLPFFAVHYGVFWFVHGVFLSTILGFGSEQGRPLALQDADGLSPSALLHSLVDSATQSGSLWAVGSLVLSHAVSYVSNFLIGGERTRTSAPKLMFSPYGRVVVMHITVLFGGWAVMALGEPIALLVLLIVLKLVIDVISHRREHAQLAPHGTAPSS